MSKLQSYQSKALKDFHLGQRHFNEDIAQANARAKEATTDEERVRCLRDLYLLGAARAAVGESRAVLKRLKTQVKK